MGVAMWAGRIGATIPLLLSILLSALPVTEGDLLGPGLAQPSLPVRHPSSVAELEGRIPGWADWRETQKNIRALRRTHGYAGTYPNIGVRPEVEPEISEDGDGIVGGRGQGMADEDKLLLEDNDLEREVWRAARQGDVASLSVRSKKIAHGGNSPSFISFFSRYHETCVDINDWMGLADRTRSRGRRRCSMPRAIRWTSDASRSEGVLRGCGKVLGSGWG